MIPISKKSSQLNHELGSNERILEKTGKVVLKENNYDIYI